MKKRTHIHEGAAAAADACASSSRRMFLAGSAAAVSLGLLGGCGASDSSRASVAPTFFRGGERDFVRAAIDRLIPPDQLGPGAVQAGVDVFIDAQLAGPFGQAVGDYMRGPFRLGTSEQGYQLPFTPAQVYRLGIQRTDAHCRSRLGDVFAKLRPEQQDDVLHQLEEGRIDLGEIPSPNFFNLLLRNAKEGFLADPIYGGNRDFAGWKLIGYRGPRYDYTNEIGKFGEPYEAPFVGLGGEHPVMCRLGDTQQGRFDGPGCEYAAMPGETHFDAVADKNGRRKWPAGNL